MLYSILKTIIDTTIIQYVCQTCQGKIDENSVKIGQIQDTQIHLDITCPHCQSHAHIHAEVANVETNIIPQSPQRPESLIIPKNKNAIQEHDIHTIEKNLKSSGSIEDLLR